MNLSVESLAYQSRSPGEIDKHPGGVNVIHLESMRAAAIR